MNSGNDAEIEIDNGEEDIPREDNNPAVATAEDLCPGNQSNHTHDKPLSYCIAVFKGSNPFKSVESGTKKCTDPVTTFLNLSLIWKNFMFRYNFLGG